MTDKPDLDAIIAKVQKLLNTEGRTPEEAAAYVAKAHAILAEYDLSIDDIGQLRDDPRTAVRKAEGIATQTAGKPDGWRSELLFGVANLFECRVMQSAQYERTKSGKYRRVHTYHLVGFGHDLESAHYAYSFLVHEIVRLAKEHVRPQWDAIKSYAVDRGISVHMAESWWTQDNGTHPLKAELYFIKGAAESVGAGLRRERYAKAREQATDNPNALVVLKKADLDDFVGREAYGDRWESVKAERATRDARWREAERAKAEALRIARENETPEQRERREAREAREAAKEAEREARRQARENERYWKEQDKIDQRAYRAGQRAGADISIRPGVGAGIGSDRGIDR